MKKKTYMRPTTELVVTAHPVCAPSITHASVFKGHVAPANKIDDITVKGEEETKYLNIWDDKPQGGDD